jgi:hypothetical protein
MPRFQIVPTDQSFPATEIVAPDAAGVLTVVQRLERRSADVMRDGEYCFTVELGLNGMWCITQTQPAPRDRVATLAD